MRERYGISKKLRIIYKVNRMIKWSLVLNSGFIY